MLDAKRGDESHQSGAPMKMADHHFIPENGGLYKMCSQIADFTCKKLNLSLFSTSVLRTHDDGGHHFIPKKQCRKYNAVSMNGESPN